MPRASRIAGERAVLRGLLDPRIAPSVRSQALRLLDGCTFSTALHALAADYIRRHPAAAAEKLREHLPAVLTHGGFPDEDWASLLEPFAGGANELLDQARGLTVGQE